MKKIIWILIAIISIFFITSITIALVNHNKDTSQQDQPNSSVQEEPKEKEKQNNQPKEKQQEESVNNDEGTLGEGIKEVFTGVIESAKNLFVKNNLHIVAMGDSLTQGVGDATNHGGYVGILQESINSNEEAEDITISNYGKRGNRTDQLLERMKSKEIKSSLKQADVVLITIGANDVMKVIKGNFPDLHYQEFVNAEGGYQDRLNLIMQRIRVLNPDVPIYLIGLYNPFDSYFKSIPELSQIMSDWNRISKEVLNNYDHTTFIPVKDIFSGSEDELLWQEDHFHPNEKGYKKIAERVLEYIKPEIQQ